MHNTIETEGLFSDDIVNGMKEKKIRNYNKIAKLRFNHGLIQVLKRHNFSTTQQIKTYKNRQKKEKNISISVYYDRDGFLERNLTVGAIILLLSPI